ncbi:MAG: P-II family nitrogen regulator [Mailhella sp.]|nr:P-II family nitrogen regulator [Mailhella sp.]
MNELHDLSSRLLIVITEKHRCDAVMTEARKAGASGGTIMFGMGTAENKWLRLLGLEDVEKELLWSVMPASLTSNVMDALRKAPCLASTRGVMFTLDISSALHLIGTPLFSAPTSSLEENMSANASASPAYELISVIVNNGGSDLVMDAAREAGATGGTVISARGTARPEDAPFFGITLVPEKELVMILCPQKDTSRIMERILKEFSDAERGAGIAFHMPVSSFETLGSKK